MQRKEATYRAPFPIRADISRSPPADTLINNVLSASRKHALLFRGGGSFCFMSNFNFVNN